MNGHTKLVPVMNVSLVRPRRPRAKRVVKINVNSDRPGHTWDTLIKDGNGRYHLAPF